MTTAPLSSLIIHPALEILPMPGEENPARAAIIRSVRELGILEPLKVTKSRVIDGRLRMLGAKAAGIEGVPVEEVPDDRAIGIIFHTLMARRHYTASGRAILAAMMADEAVRESWQRAVDRARLGKHADSSARTAPCDREEQYAEAFGVSRRLYFSAKEILRKLTARPELRDLWLAKILDGEMSVGAAQQALAGQIAALEHRTHPKGDANQLLLGFFETGETRLARWALLTAAQKERAEEEYVEKVLNHLPEQLLKRTERYLRERKAARAASAF
jgi:hypothetical protein